MQVDVSGWATRLDTEMAARYTAQGTWTGRTLADAARERATTEGGRVAVIDGAFRVSFGELYERGVRLAASLRAGGLQRGEVVSFQLPNWHEAMVVNMAACIGGFVCNPIVPIYRDAEVGFILKQSRTRILFIPASFRSFDYVDMVERLRPGLPDLRQVALVRSRRDGSAAYTDWVLGDGSVEALAASFAPVNADAIKLLLYTSGTTGEPKGVLHSHNTIGAEINAASRFWSLSSRDVVLMPSPVTHITGYLYALEMCAAVAMKTVLMERWDAVDALRLIAEHGASFTVAATPFLLELGNEAARSDTPLPTLRLFASGGAPVPAELVRRATAALPGCLTFRVYGSSEAPTVSLGVRAGDSAELGAATDGAICNHEVRIVDAVTGAILPVGHDGEIITRGPELMLGYTNPAYTAEAFDTEGFFHTGDLGSVDSAGYLTVSGRKKDLIIRGGENISPKEIEDVLHGHPSVLEAAVVAMPHERLGETPCAYVVLRPQTQFDFAAMTDLLEQAGLARQKFPARLFVVRELPHTAAGKVLKQVLRARASEAVGTSVPAAPHSAFPSAS